MSGENLTEKGIEVDDEFQKWCRDIYHAKTAARSKARSSKRCSFAYALVALGFFLGVGAMMTAMGG